MDRTFALGSLSEMAIPVSEIGVADFNKFLILVSAEPTADGAALYSSTGVNMGGNGVLAYWIQEVINAVSGNLDRPGGCLVGRGISLPEAPERSRSCASRAKSSLAAPLLWQRRSRFGSRVCWSSSRAPRRPRGAGALLERLLPG